MSTSSDSENPRASQGRRNYFSKRLAANATERRMPKMHWRWRNRGRDITALLGFRFRSVLPNDDYGLDAVKLIAQHYMRLNLDAERVTRANLQLWAPWLDKKDLANIIETARKAKTPTAEQFGRAWRVSVDEVAALGLTTVKPFVIICRDDATRQARRRRKAGASEKRGRRPVGRSEAEKTIRKRKQSAKSSKKHRVSKSTGKRGRRPLNLSPEQKKAHTNALAAERMRKKRAAALRENPCSKNRHASSLYKDINRDEINVTDLSVTSATPVDIAVMPANVVYLAARSISISKATCIPIDLKVAA